MHLKRDPNTEGEYYMQETIHDFIALNSNPGTQKKLRVLLVLGVTGNLSWT